MKRRDLFKLGLFSSTALAVTGCGLPPQTKLISQLDMPELRLPGKSRWFATTCGECGGGCGVSVRVVDGRAKKLEGIPEHPISHGKVCARGMSSVQALYNPDRLYQPLQGSAAAVWEESLKTLASQMDSGSGKTLWVTRTLRGSTGSLILALAEKVGAKVWVLDMDGNQAQRAAVKGLTGQSGLPYHDLKNADFVLNFGADFLNNGASPVHYNWGYGEMRGAETRGLMVSFSAHMNTTISNSDRWVPVRPGGEAWAALAIGNALVAAGKKGPWLPWAKSIKPDVIAKHVGPDFTPDMTQKLVRRLMKAQHPIAIGGGHVAGYSNGPWQLQVITALSRLLGGGSLPLWEPDGLVNMAGAKVNPQVMTTTQEALKALNAAAYTTLWCLDTNPVYLFTGSSFNIAETLKKATNRVCFTPYANETSALEGTLVLPIATWLEGWGDARVEGPLNGYNSTAIYNVQQPAVELRPGALSLTDVLLDAAHRSKSGAGFKWATTQDLIREHTGDRWSEVEARGGVYDAYPLDWEPYASQAGPLGPPRVVPKAGTVPGAAGTVWEGLRASATSGPQESQFQGDASGLVLIPYLSSVFGDGYAANRPWLQELSDPVAMVVWTDFIEISLQLANEKGIQRGDILRLTSPAGTVEGPAYPTPGVHPEAVAIPLGQGHFNYGRYAGRGMQVLQVLVPQFHTETGELALVSTRVSLEKTDRNVSLISLDRRLGGQPREAFPKYEFKQNFEEQHHYGEPAGS